MKKSILLFLVVMAGLAVFYPPKDKVVFAPVEKTIEITVEEGTNMAVALSPDKKTLVLDLQGRLWLMPVEGGEAKAFTDRFGDAREPHWSPDGTSLTFQGYWDGNWHIYTVNRDGSDLQQLTHGPYDHREPHWSPDGQQIAFSSDRVGTYDIWTLDLVNEKLTAITNGLGNEYAPAWNNSGNRLAYISDNPDKPGIYYHSFLKDSEKLVCTAEGKLSGLSWRPDGTSIFFVQQDFDESNLMQIWLDMPEPLSITKSKEDVFPFRATWISNQEYIYTADGKIKKRNASFEAIEHIPFSATFTLQRPVYSRKKRNFDPRSQPTQVKGITHPVLAPDGQQFAYIALNNVWIQEEEGTLVQVTKDVFAKLTPTWSPDGQYLAYISDPEGHWGIYSYERSSGKTTRIGKVNGTPSGISWSPDGKSIAYSTNFGPRLGQLWVMDTATGQSKKIRASIPSSIGSPTWSPDGKTIGITTLAKYSSRFREGINRLLFFSSDGTQSWSWKGLPNWSLGVRAKDGPVWSPDGKHMAAISNGVLWMVPVNKRGEVAGLPIRLTNELADIPSWSGDSRFILYQSNEKIKKINVQTGDIEVLNVPLKYTTHYADLSKKTVIHVKGLFDGKTNIIRKNKDIIIRGNRIVSIEDHLEGRIADKFIDASNAYALPGLIDIHAHQGSWCGEKLGRAWLSWGVTATRDPATDPYDALNRREAREAGLMPGPRIFFTGSPIDGNRIYYAGSYAFQSPAQLALELERAVSLDYDMIKTYVRLPDPIQEKVIQKAHQLGLPVSSHELYPAVSYGIDGVEHIAGTSRRGYSPKLTATLSSYGDVTRLIGRSGMSFTPTIGIYVSYNYLLHKNPQALEDERLQKLESPFNIQNAKSGISQVEKDSVGWEKRFKNACKMIRDIHRENGLISAGTDGPILPYGFGFHMELEAYQEAGLSPFEVLQTATINNAQVLGTEEDMGTLEAGKLADLVIVEKNPLEDVKNARSVMYTIIDGQVFSQQDLLKEHL